MKNCIRFTLAALLIAAFGMLEAPAAGARPPSANRSTAKYVVPNVNLVRQDGKSVSLPEELDDGRPVVMNFIFTTCTSICPLLTQTFMSLQRELGGGRDKVHLVSVSIDPEADTPARLSAYAKTHKAGPEWQFYTGTTEAIITTARAFYVYHGDKMAHTPVTFVRKAPGEPWVRFDGFATADELIKEIKSEDMAGR